MSITLNEDDRILEEWDPGEMNLEDYCLNSGWAYSELAFYVDVEEQWIERPCDYFATDAYYIDVLQELEVDGRRTLVIAY